MRLREAPYSACSARERRGSPSRAGPRLRFCRRGGSALTRPRTARTRRSSFTRRSPSRSSCTGSSRRLSATAGSWLRGARSCASARRPPASPSRRWSWPCSPAPSPAARSERRSSPSPTGPSILPARPTRSRPSGSARSRAQRTPPTSRWARPFGGHVGAGKLARARLDPRGERRLRGAPHATRAPSQPAWRRGPVRGARVAEPRLAGRHRGPRRDVGRDARGADTRLRRESRRRSLRALDGLRGKAIAIGARMGADAPTRLPALAQLHDRDELVARGRLRRDQEALRPTRLLRGR